MSGTKMNMAEFFAMRVGARQVLSDMQAIIDGDPDKSVSETEQPKQSKEEYILTSFSTVGEAVQAVYDDKDKYYYSYRLECYEQARIQHVVSYWEGGSLYEKVLVDSWWENIPENGVLCWCTNGHLKPYISVVLERVDHNVYITQDDGNNSFTKYATPLTREEVMSFV